METNNRKKRIYELRSEFETIKNKFENGDISYYKYTDELHRLLNELKKTDTMSIETKDSRPPFDFSLN